LRQAARRRTIACHEPIQFRRIIARQPENVHPGSGAGRLDRRARA
jgi:hypothetical protein